jgi:hypothetical protein
MATAIRQDEMKDARTEPCAWPTLESIEQAVRTARRTVSGARYATEDLVAAAGLQVRRHPLAAVALAVVGGLAFGGVAGFTAGWFTGRRR